MKKLIIIILSVAFVVCAYAATKVKPIRADSTSTFYAPPEWGELRFTHAMATGAAMRQTLVFIADDGTIRILTGGKEGDAFALKTAIVRQQVN